MTTSAWYSRAKIDRFVQSNAIQNFIIIVILVNAAVLGFETSPAITTAIGPTLVAIDKTCLAIFIVEISLKLYAQRLAFFKNSWNVFDFIIVGIALVPGADGLAVLRALRVLRVLRHISVVPALRRVVDALVRAIPGIASIAALLAVVFYVGAVMATMLFGPKFQAEYGDLTSSLFSLFQIMTLDGWGEQVRRISAELPFAPAFFIPFVLISALTVLNLFIAVIVDAMQDLGHSDKSDDATPVAAPIGDEVLADASSVIVIESPERDDVARELAALREQVETLTRALVK